MNNERPIDPEEALNKAVYGLNILGIVFVALTLIFLIPVVASRALNDHESLALATVALTPGVIANVSAYFLKRRQMWAGKAAATLVATTVGVTGAVLLLLLVCLPETWVGAVITAFLLVNLSVLYYWLHLGLHALRRREAPPSLGFTPLIIRPPDDQPPPPP